MDAMYDADANTDADDPGTRYENAPADSRPAYERAALLWQGKCLWCNIVSRHKLLLQRQPE
jgi:hypothetical protein